MEVLNKKGEWLKVNTEHLFNNQYNVIDTEGVSSRLCDSEILAVRDDAREGMGKCAYCGKTLKIGEEEQHFKEEESKSCDKCFWFREVLINTDYAKTSREVEENVIERVETITSLYHKECTSKEGCYYEKCREKGVIPFTPENTFSLKYPSGLPLIPIERFTLEKGWDVEERRSYGLKDISYIKKIGSYRMYAIISYDKEGHEQGVTSFNIYNNRRHYRFRVLEGKFYIIDGIGYEKHKYLPDVPYDVCIKLKEICGEE